jgi:hypothetical protein
VNVTNGELRFGNTPVRATGDGSFAIGSSRVTFTNDASGKPSAFDLSSGGDTIRFTAQPKWDPDAAELSGLAGDWYSDEAEATIKFAVEGATAFLLIRHSPRIKLTPLYKDHFSDEQGQIIWFDRDVSGSIVKMHVGGARMRDMPFVRVR